MAGCDKDEEEEDEEQQAFLDEFGLPHLSYEEHWDKRSSSESSLNLGPDDSASCSSSEGDLVLEASNSCMHAESPAGSDAILDLESEAPRPEAANGWLPGWNCGPNLLRTANWHDQARVLVVNVYLALQRLPQHALKTLTTCMDSGTKGPSLSLHAASGLLRLSATSIWRTFNATRENDWEFADDINSSASPAEDGSLTSSALLIRLTRVALGVRDSSGSSLDYPKWLARLETEGVPIGDKYHTWHHYADCIYLAARTVQCLHEDDRRCPLGGLGISSNFAVLFDGVPMGGVSAYGRHGTVQVVCFNAVSPHTGRLHAWLATSIVQGKGHGGKATAEAMTRFGPGPARPFPRSERPRQLSCTNGPFIHVFCSWQGSPQRTIVYAEEVPGTTKQRWRHTRIKFHHNMFVFNHVWQHLRNGGH